jgi:hypothetical protein
VTNEGVRAVAGLMKLTHLILRSRLVTSEGVRAIAGLTNLTHLYLISCAVTDVGLQHLISSLKKLCHINLSQCNTSEAAEEELRRQIPGLTIEHLRLA